MKSDRTRRKSMSDRAYDYEGRIQHLLDEVEEHRQIMRIATACWARPISVRDIQVGTVLRLRVHTLLASDPGGTFPYLPFRVTAKKKSRAYAGTYPPQWNLDLEPVGHEHHYGRMGVRSDEWLWADSQVSENVR